MNSRLGKILPPLAVIAVVIAFWWWIVVRNESPIFPTPWAVVTGTLAARTADQARSVSPRSAGSVRP